jgi:hypothetical protein
MFNNPFYLYITMNNQEKKAGDQTGSFSLLNQLITSLEDTEIKLEAACKKDSYEEAATLKNFILKIQKQIAEEIK